MVWLKISATERDLENHQKLPNFAGSLWPSHLTKIWSWGTNGKRISISFIWYLVMQNISIILVTLTTFTTRGQTENEKMGSDMSISSEVPDQSHLRWGIPSRAFRLASLCDWRRLWWILRVLPVQTFQRPRQLCEQREPESCESPQAQDRKAQEKSRTRSRNSRIRSWNPRTRSWNPRTRSRKPGETNNNAKVLWLLSCAVCTEVIWKYLTLLSVTQF